MKPRHRVCVCGLMVVSIHVPKCAGTSFRNVLSDQFGSRLWLNYGSIFTEADFRPELIPANTACIHGHFLGDAFDSFVPRPRFMTWVRHPVDRVVSNYYHCLRSPDLRDDCCRRLHEEKLSLRGFAELDWMKTSPRVTLRGKRSRRLISSVSPNASMNRWPSSVAPLVGRLRLVAPARTRTQIG